MSASRRMFFRISWVILVAAVIAAELLPGDALPLKELAWLHISDKVQHFSGYTLLALLPALSERAGVVALSALGAVVLGVALEFAQLLTATRHFEFADMVANTLGVCAGLVLAWPLRRVLG